MGKIADAAAFTGDLLRLLGFNLNFAPVLDLDHFPDQQNALRGRCWGRDPQRVIDYAGQWNRWLRKRSIAGCAKHFPAGGRALSDPHHDLPSSPATLDELLREDVIPYTALMPELDAIMLAHVEFPNIDPDFPASLSPRIIRRFLRDQLGFDKHLVLTDDLDMGAITTRYGRGEDVKLAITAGNDLAMICHRTETAETAARAIAGAAALDDRGSPRPHRTLPPEKTPPAARLVGPEMGKGLLRPCHPHRGVSGRTRCRNQQPGGGVLMEIQRTAENLVDRLRHFLRLEIEIDLSAAVGAAAFGIVLAGFGDVRAARLAGALGDGDDLIRGNARLDQEITDHIGPA